MMQKFTPHQIARNSCRKLKRCTLSTIQHPQRLFSTKPYVIKEERIDGIFADQKNNVDNYEVYDTTGKIDTIPNHLRGAINSAKAAPEKIPKSMPSLKPISKDTKINPGDYSIFEDMDKLKEQGVRTKVEDPDYYKKYNHVQTHDILNQGIVLEMPVLPQVIPDKPFDQMSAEEFKSYASEHMNRRLMASQIKIPKPRVGKDGKLTREAIMNASNSDIDLLLKQSQKSREMLKSKQMDSMAKTEWEAVLSLEEQLKQIIKDEDKIYEPIKPDRPSFKHVAIAFLATLLFANAILALANPGVRALVFRPLAEKITEMSAGKRAREGTQESA